MAFFNNVDFDSLSEVDKAIWQYIQLNSDRVKYMRVRDVAQEAHVAPSSVMRFIHKLGYENFPEFRLGFKEDRREEPVEGVILSERMFPKDLNARLTTVSKEIVNCENLLFFGVGNSSYVAEFASRLFCMIGINASAWVDVTYPMLDKLKNTSDNVLIFLSVSGQTNEVLEALNLIHNSADYTSVAITADAASKLATTADYLLHYRTEIKKTDIYKDFTSPIPAIHLIERLFEEVREMLDSAE